jgi:plastocyanin
MKAIFLAVMMALVAVPALAGGYHHRHPGHRQPGFPGYRPAPGYGYRPAPGYPGYPAAYGTVYVNIPYGAAAAGPYAFGANPLLVRPGTQVVWVNNDSMPHTVTSSGGWFHAELPPGWSSSLVFWNFGDYPYYCGYHPNMWGTVRVVP